MTIHVTHFTPHVSTGIGKSLSSLAIGAKKYDPEISHEIVVLGRQLPEYKFFWDRCERHGVPISEGHTPSELNEKIIQSDIVQIEWYHHPLSFKFIHNLPKFPMRLVMWYHINGCNHPWLNPGLVDIPSKFVGTGKYMYDNPHWTESQRDHIKQNVPLVNSSGGYNGFDAPLQPQHEGFNVGYYGTLDYAKLSPKFVEYCCAVADLPGIRFVMVGPLDGSEHLKRDIKDYGLEDKFVFKGFVQHPELELAQFDIGAYLLNDYVFNTTENALLEQMAMGVPVITFDQCSEHYIITDGVGIKIKTKRDFMNAVKSLYQSRAYCKELGNNASKYVRSTFTCENMVRGLHSVYREILHQPAKMMDFNSVIGKTPHEWFGSCLAPVGDAMNHIVMESHAKQSLNQFMGFFPEDQELKGFNHGT